MVSSDATQCVSAAVEAVLFFGFEFFVYDIRASWRVDALAYWLGEERKAGERRGGCELASRMTGGCSVMVNLSHNK